MTMSDDLRHMNDKLTESTLNNFQYIKMFARIQVVNFIQKTVYGF